MTSTPLDRITDYLVRDHERLHALLEAAMAGGRFSPAPFAIFRQGLLRHIAIEEKVLLPAARLAQGDVPLARAFDLRVDHAALTSLLVPPPDVALCREIASLLAVHDAKEEGPEGVYAECEALFSPARSAALAAEAIGFRSVRVAPHLDRPGVYRTAAAALAAARRMKPPKEAERP